MSVSSNISAELSGARRLREYTSLIQHITGKALTRQYAVAFLIQWTALALSDTRDQDIVLASLGLLQGFSGIEQIGARRKKYIRETGYNGREKPDDKETRKNLTEAELNRRAGRMAKHEDRLFEKMADYYLGVSADAIYSGAVRERITAKTGKAMLPEPSYLKNIRTAYRAEPLANLIYKRFEINPKNESPEFLGELVYLTNEHWNHYVENGSKEWTAYQQKGKDLSTLFSEIVSPSDPALSVSPITMDRAKYLSLLTEDDLFAELQIRYPDYEKTPDYKMLKRKYQGSASSMKGFLIDLLNALDDIDEPDSVKSLWEKYGFLLFSFIKDNRDQLLTQIKKDVQDSHFVDGKRDGYGVRTLFSGDRYEGDWKDGHYEGGGVIIFADGKRREGIFVNGNIVPPFRDIRIGHSGKPYEITETLSADKNRCRIRGFIFDSVRTTPKTVIIGETVDGKLEGKTEIIFPADEYRIFIDYHNGEPVGGFRAIENAEQLPIEDETLYNRNIMNRREYIDRLEALNLPKDQFIILSGGSLLLRGLRESTADFDLCVMPKLAKELDLYNAPQDEAGCYVPLENVQMKDDYDNFDYDIVDGFQCESLESILEFKRKMRRPKDIKDIEAIEKYLAEHPQESQEN